MVNYWYKNAVIYSLDIKSFADGNGDGIGDLAGLMQKLDYLACLGINCIWLQPLHPSPWKDGGYDVADHYAIDERLGSLPEFIKMTELARERGIRIMMDLVANHTSDQHPWFKDARKHKNSAYRDYYVWETERPRYHRPNIIFTGKQDSNWAYDKMAKAWYYHTFYPFQPDLNISHPKVQDEIKNILRFWIKLGVSGFRIDAVPHMLRKKGKEQLPGDAHDLLRKLRTFVDEQGEDIVLMGEADTQHESYSDFFGERDQLHMLLNFHLNNHLFLALAQKKARPLTESLNELLPNSADCNQFANFVRNHDELNIGQLNSTQQKTVLNAFAPDNNMRIYETGIRRRLPTMLNNDPRCIKLTYSLLFSLPGTPVLRYGEEIGMGDALALSERNSVRTAMQWTDGKNGGFSNNSSSWPTISKGPYSFKHINVAAQAQDRNSLLNTLSRMISLRKAYSAFGWGQYEIIDCEHPGVLIHVCRRDSNVAVAIHNFTGDTVDVSLSLPEEERALFTEILADQAYEQLNGKVRINGYGYRWFCRWPLA